MNIVQNLKQELRFIIEDHFLFRPKPGSKTLPQPDARAADQPIERILKNLRTTALASFPGFISEHTLGEIRKSIADVYSGKRKDIVLNAQKDVAYDVIANPLMLNPELLKIATDPFLVSIIENYFQCDVYLADVDMRRVYPISMEDFEKKSEKNRSGYSSSHWHYDTRGRQIKIMIYLSDVDESSQNFAYCPGTHLPHPAISRSRTDFSASRYSDDWVKTHKIESIECYGKSGTLMLFDTNCVHRLRRKNSSIRDTFTCYYTPGQELRPLDYSPEFLKNVPQQTRRILGGKR